MHGGRLPPGSPVQTPLTTLEFDALRLAADGGTGASIGAELGLSADDVAAALKAIRLKLAVPSTAEAVAAASVLPGWT